MKSMESFFGNMTNFIDQYGSSEMTRNSVLIDLQYIFIMCVCITGVPEKVQHCWLIIYDSFWHCHSQLEVCTSWDKRGTRPILSQFEIIWMTLNRLVPKLVSKHSKTRLPLELWTAFNYFVTLSNSKSVTKSSQYVTWPLNWYHIIWPKYNMGREL